MTDSEAILGLLIGIGLSAACGFRIFVPLLGMSIASMTSHLTLAPGFEWIGSPLAVTTFAVATVLEIAAYYIPWVDNALDSVATPSAVIAGTIVTAAMVGDMSPFLRWTLAAIAGGGAAALVQGGTVVVRGASSGTTGGLANPLVSTGEAAASTTMTLLAILVPVVAAILVVLFAVWMVRLIVRAMRKRRTHAAAPSAT
jgi:hypothetical protein